MIAWALEALVTSTLLMLLVLGIRTPIAQLFGAEWAYALWLLPVAVPLLPRLSALAPAAAPEMTVILPALGQVAGEAPQHGGSGDWLLVLLALWAGGAIIFAIWQQSTYSAFMLHLGKEGRGGTPPSYGGIRVAVSDAVEGPVAIGIFRRRIVVPLDFTARYTPAERRLALEHELIHHKRLDLVWNWAALALLTLNWFNPIAHIAFRAFRADQELACDAAVARRASAADRHDYACALVKAATQSGPIAVCALNHAAFLKRRLKMMKQHRSSGLRTAGGLASLSLAGVAGLALGGPGFAHEQPPAIQVVRTAPGAQAAIAPTELARLSEKCGGGGGAAIVCTGKDSKDPEVRRILNKAVKKAEVRAEAAPVIAKAVAEARAEAISPIAEEQVETRVAARVAADREGGESAGEEIQAARIQQMVEVRETLARARGSLPPGAGHFRVVTLARLSPAVRPRVITIRLPHVDKAAIEAALTEARHEIAREVSREVSRELEIEREVELSPAID